MTSVRGMSDLEIEGKFIHPGSQSSDFSVRQDSVRCVIRKSKGRNTEDNENLIQKATRTDQMDSNMSTIILLYMPAHPTI